MLTNQSDENIRRSNIRQAWQILNDGNVRYFAKRSDGSAVGGRVKSPEALERAARNLESLGYDVYLHLNPSIGNGLKATSRQVTAFHRILIDLDPVDPACDPSEGILSILAVADAIQPGTYMAAHTLLTGRGAHAWVEFEPHTPERAERATANFLKQLKAAWDNNAGYRIDSVCYDLGRIVRCPGTRNTRSGLMATFLRPAAARLASEAFINKFYTDPPSQAIERPKNISNLITVSAHLNGLAREFLHNGVEEGDRHHAAYAAAKSLADVGMGSTSIRYWILRGASRCRPRLSKRDALHCVKTALKE